MDLTAQTQSSGQEQLPDFERPPVVETVLGVQFDPLDRFHVAALGAYWKTLGPDWRQTEEAPPLAQQFEDPEKAGWLQLRLRVQKLAAEKFAAGFSQDSRLRIRNESHDRMIQVQNSRFHYNWVGHESDSVPAYPRYSRTKEEFLAYLTGFKQFLEHEGLGDFSANQWEITYVNHIHKGTLWETPQDWPQVLELLSGASSAVPTGNLQRTTGTWTYGIDAYAPARLHVNVNHKVNRQDPSKEILELILTARGPIGDTYVSLEKGLDIGHVAIVEGFTALTSQKAHEHWGRLR